MHALVIEDHGLTAWLIEEELKDLGYTSCDTAATEREAVAAAERRRPDLITSDGRLAEGNGVSAVRTICAGRAIPVLFITADSEQARQFAPDAVILDKPFNSTELVSAVERAGPNRMRELREGAGR